MWIMTPYGFFSIVCAHADEDPARGSRGPAPHPDLMMIRARKHSHLVALQQRDGNLPEITTNEGTDYPYRIIAGRDTVMHAVAGMTEDVRYTNFKDEAKRANPNDSAFHSFLMSIWSLGLSLTPARVKRRQWPTVQWSKKDPPQFPPIEDVLTAKEAEEYYATVGGHRRNE